MDDPNAWSVPLSTQTNTSQPNGFLDLPSNVMERIFRLLSLSSQSEACLIHKASCLPAARSVLYEAPRFQSGSSAQQFIETIRKSKTVALLVRSLYLCGYEIQDPMFRIINKSSSEIHRQQNNNSLSQPKLILYLVKACEKITSLTIYSDNVDSRYIEQIIATATDLRTLELIGSKVKEAPYVHGMLSRLQSLRLDGHFMLSENCAAHMSRATHLTTLQISLSDIKIPVLEKLCKNVPDLAHLTLTDASNFQDNDVYCITQLFRRLKSFVIQGTKNITEASLFSALSFCPELQHLEVRADPKTNVGPVQSLDSYGTPPDHIIIPLRTLVLENFMMDDKWFQLMSSKLKQLKNIGLKSCPNLTNLSIASLLKHCNELNTFHTRDCLQISMRPFSQYIHLRPFLKFLDLERSGAVSPTDINQVCTTGKLQWLRITGYPQLRNSSFADNWLDSDNTLELYNEDILEIAKDGYSDPNATANGERLLTKSHVSQLAQRLGIPLNQLEHLLDDITGEEEILSYDSNSNSNNKNNNINNINQINQDYNDDDDNFNISDQSKSTSGSIRSSLSQDWLNRFDANKEPSVPGSETEGVYSDDEYSYNNHFNQKRDDSSPTFDAWHNENNDEYALNQWQKPTKNNTASATTNNITAATANTTSATANSTPTIDFKNWPSQSYSDNNAATLEWPEQKYINNDDNGLPEWPKQNYTNNDDNGLPEWREENYENNDVIDLKTWPNQVDNSNDISSSNEMDTKNDGTNSEDNWEEKSNDSASPSDEWRMQYNNDSAASSEDWSPQNETDTTTYQESSMQTNNHDIPTLDNWNAQIEGVNNGYTSKEEWPLPGDDKKQPVSKAPTRVKNPWENVPDTIRYTNNRSSNQVNKYDDWNSNLAESQVRQLTQTAMEKQQPSHPFSASHGRSQPLLASEGWGSTPKNYVAWGDVHRHGFNQEVIEKQQNTQYWELENGEWKLCSQDLAEYSTTSGEAPPPARYSIPTKKNRRRADSYHSSVDSFTEEHVRSKLPRDARLTPDHAKSNNNNNNKKCLHDKYEGGSNSSNNKGKWQNDNIHDWNNMKQSNTSNYSENTSYTHNNNGSSDGAGEKTNDSFFSKSKKHVKTTRGPRKTTRSNISPDKMAGKWGTVFGQESPLSLESESKPHSPEKTVPVLIDVFDTFSLNKPNTHQATPEQKLNSKNNILEFTNLMKPDENILTPATTTTTTTTTARQSVAITETNINQSPEIRSVTPFQELDLFKGSPTQLHQKLNNGEPSSPVKSYKNNALNDNNNSNSSNNKNNNINNNNNNNNNSNSIKNNDNIPHFHDLFPELNNNNDKPNNVFITTISNTQIQGSTSSPVSSSPSSLSSTAAAAAATTSTSTSTESSSFSTTLKLQITPKDMVTVRVSKENIREKVSEICDKYGITDPVSVNKYVSNVTERYVKKQTDDVFKVKKKKNFF